MRHFSSSLVTRFLTTLTLALLTMPATATSAKILYTFQGNGDGGRPWAGLLLDEKTGILYGTTEIGGNQLCQNSFDIGCGTVFALVPSANGWTEKILHRFQAGSDGSNPRAPLVPRPDGYFYSTTTTGGGYQQSGTGTLFRIKPGTGQEQALFSFSVSANGWYPQGQIAFDSTGNIYGLTVNGGALGADGVAFELLPNSGGGWTEQVLNSSVGLPYAGVILDDQGNVFGTTDENGTYDEGSVFELSHGNTGWLFTNIYSFTDPCGVFCGGTAPSDLTADKNGDLFGFTADGGIACQNGIGCGTVFEMTRSGEAWEERTVYEFQNVADGWGPGYGAPTLDRFGNLYGTTQAGGQYGFGTVFKLSQVNGVWQKATLYSFSGGAGGNSPIGGLVVDRHGNLFGTTYWGGKTVGKTCKRQGCGVVFEITP
jgi:uncharacterized repeat protein (TIGR03803 family)